MLTAQRVLMPSHCVRPDPGMKAPGTASLPATLGCRLLGAPGNAPDCVRFPGIRDARPKDQERTWIQIDDIAPRFPAGGRLPVQFSRTWSQIVLTWLEGPVYRLPISYCRTFQLIQILASNYMEYTVILRLQSSDHSSGEHA